MQSAVYRGTRGALRASASNDYGNHEASHAVPRDHHEAYVQQMIDLESGGGATRTAAASRMPVYYPLPKKLATSAYR